MFEYSFYLLSSFNLNFNGYICSKMYIPIPSTQYKRALSCTSCATRTSWGKRPKPGCVGWWHITKVRRLWMFQIGFGNSGGPKIKTLWRNSWSMLTGIRTGDQQHARVMLSKHFCLQKRCQILLLFSPAGCLYFSVGDSCQEKECHDRFGGRTVVLRERNEGRSRLVHVPCLKKG